MIDLADGDPTKGNLIIGSPLVAAIMLRGCARCCLGDHRLGGDIETGRGDGPLIRCDDARDDAALQIHASPLATGQCVPDAADLQETAEVLEIAERSGDDLTLACARVRTRPRAGGAYRRSPARRCLSAARRGP